MKKFRCALLILLVVCLLLSGCASDNRKAEETAAPTAAPVVAATQTPTEAPTEAPTEPVEPARFMLKETVFPEKDAATGTLKFYINDQEVYAGGPVSNLIATGVTTYEDLDQLVQPWHMTSVLRVRVELENVTEADKPFVFFIAMNASDEPQKVSDCLLYSVTINTDKDILFGSGKENAPFTTGVTTLAEIRSAYGEPDYDKSAHADFREIAYYEPFSCAYFTFKNDVLRQVTTYYSANVLGHLAEGFTYDLGAEYFGNDAFILMNQYMDVQPYLPGSTATIETGVLEALTETITLDGKDLTMGISCAEMPAPFVDHLNNQLIHIEKMYYCLVGRNVGEEFYFINLNGQKESKSNTLVVKGAFTANKNYVNWGWDNSLYHDFRYENLTQDSTIEDILENYGQPYQLDCTSYGRACFVWMFYKDKAGNTLEICVDPMLDQIMELRFSKYFEGEIMYV